MKKIRLLAILLAILMMPLGMFFSCNDEEDSDADKEKEEEEDDDDDDESSTSPKPVVSKVVEDGFQKDGAFIYFTFDNAENGNLGVVPSSTNPSDLNYNAKPVEPYYSNFKGTVAKGGAYTVRTLTSTNKYLSIERTGGVYSSPMFDFNVGTAVTGVTAKHIIQFKMDFTNGLFGAPVSFSGVKGSSVQNFFTIKNNIMYDCNGVAIYGEKSTDKQGWIRIDIVINDTVEDTRRQKYDIYIDLVKQTNGVEFSNYNYQSFSQNRSVAYRFSISGNDNADTYFRVDDINVRNGEEKALGALAGLDYDTKVYDNLTFEYSFLNPDKGGLINLVSADVFGTPVSYNSLLNSVTGLSEIMEIKTKDVYATLKGDNDQTIVLNGSVNMTVDTGNLSAGYEAITSGKLSYITFVFDEAEWDAVPRISGQKVAAVKCDAVKKRLEAYKDASCSPESKIATVFNYSGRNNNGDTIIFASGKMSFEINTRDGSVVYKNSAVGSSDAGGAITWDGLKPYIGEKAIASTKYSTNGTSKILSAYADKEATDKLGGDFVDNSSLVFVNINNQNDRFTLNSGTITYDNNISDDTPAVTGTYTTASESNNEAIYTISWSGTAPSLGGKSIAAVRHNKVSGAFRACSDAACTETLGEYREIKGTTVYTSSTLPVTFEVSENSITFSETCTGKHSYTMELAWDKESEISNNFVAIKYTETNSEKYIVVYTNEECTDEVKLEKFDFVSNSPWTFKKGNVTFKIENSGKVTHTMNLSGTYTESEQLFTFNWGIEWIGPGKPSAFKYNSASDEIEVYLDSECTQKIAALALPVKTVVESIDSVVYNNGNAQIKFTTDGTVTYDNDVTDTTSAVTGTYSVASGVVTFTWNGTAPTVESEEIKAAKYDFDTETVSLYSDTACENKLADMSFAPDASKYVVGENEKKISSVYAVKMGNGSSVVFDTIWYANNKINLSALKMQFYVNTSEEFKIKAYMGSATVEITAIKGEEIKFSVSDNKATFNYIEGFNSYEFTADELKKAGVDLGKLTKLEIVYTGSNPSFALYFTKLGYDLSNVKIEIKEPNAANPDCTHEDDNGDGTFVSLGVQQGSCAYGSHILLECSQCGATKVDAAVGNIAHHNYKKDKHGNIIHYTEEATCNEEGRVYRVCADCGCEETVSKIDVKGHDYRVVGYEEGSIVCRQCSVCGYTDKIRVVVTPMTFEEKLVELGYDATQKNNWSATQEGNTNVDSDSSLGRWGTFWCKSGGTTLKKADGGAYVTTVSTEYGSMLKVTGGKGKEVVLNFQPGANRDTAIMQTVSSFVLEFDYMIESSSGQIRVMVINSSKVSQQYGHLVLDGMTARLWSWNATPNQGYDNNRQGFNMTEGVVYSIACHYDITRNVLSLYVDGRLIDQVPFAEDTEASATFKPTYWQMYCANFPETGRVYYNNILFYPAELQPIGLVTEGLRAESDIEGEIKLQDELLNDMLPDFSVNTNGYSDDINMLVPLKYYFKDYRLEFSIKAESTLSDGVLLSGIKYGNGMSPEQDIVTVKGGKLYVMDVLVSESTDVKLTLDFDDNTNTLTVYVNGQQIPGTINFDGEYADSAAWIRGFTLLNECGSYEVSGLKFVSI